MKEKIECKSFRLGKGVFVLDPKGSIFENAGLVIHGIKVDLKDAMEMKKIAKQDLAGA